MAEDFKYLNFIPGVRLPKFKNKEDMWFVFNNGNMLVSTQNGRLTVPRYSEVEEMVKGVEKIHFLGSYEGINCYTCEGFDLDKKQNEMVSRPLRSLLEAFNDKFFLLCGRALQVINWDRNHKYCGRCGTKMDYREDERSKLCPSCGLINYPRISPAVIVAIVRDRKILLAHNKQFANNMYSVIAGFLDPGETFEDCVKREISEEVGIRVKNIKYFASQPWPFPDSLMVAFTAEYMDGEISVDGVEIDDASWYSVSEIPRIPSKGSVAGRLIHWFIENYSDAE